ncbi:Extracellular solute-binding protein, family 7 [Caldalkalibacillus thermarum TA2.A1]|uniref:Extracellular solute-binding protein, family 7 n=1 Tax=Caldalkalibacillus thermarum (strain TA2.A1) TaxID=986075 RepID=F5L6B1_CALTT|nr:TRAP transporter substrate-binding protein [Caldalkalibacillus thermarum]EGL83111.1 Extracellular solute-binding protein, family 7 [Caldalkalibacillus thermarum TA2.A1]QZT32474.1 TRAP transporter substrate-binding protein [Caldalkalibacillus thermarum TA2.A1]
MKKEWKRWTGFWVFLVLILLLSACQAEQAGSSEGGETEAAAGEQITLKFSHFWPPHHFVQTEVFEPFVDEMGQLSDGRVTIDIYPASALGEPGAQYDMAVTGVADITVGVHSYTPGQFPLVSVMELPFISDSGEKGSEILWKLYEEFPELKEEHAQTKPLWLFTSSPGQLLTVGKPVESIDDLRGMRIRSPSPIMNKVIELAGATPVSMPMSDVYDAMQRGVVDGTFAPMPELLAFNLMDVTDYVTIGNFYMTTFFAVMNGQVWEGLTAEEQQKLEELGLSMARKGGKAFDQAAAEAREALADSDVEVYELSEEDVAEWKSQLESIIQDWIEEMNSKGLPGQEIYDRAVQLNSELN